jgi:choline dehydrogenase-like flavoprotein
MEADAIVVGSGIAGAFAAWKLAQSGVRVLVLEAGPRIDRAQIVAGFASTHNFDMSAGYPNASWAPRPDWGNGPDKFVNQAGPEVAQFEYLRVVGGTTWHWSGGAERLSPVDMRLRSTYGVGADWPIQYDDIEPSYLEVEREIGLAGDQGAGGPPRSAPFPLPPIPLGYMENEIGRRLRDIGMSVLGSPAARNSVPFDGRPQCDGYGTCTPICPIGAQYSAIVHVEKKSPELISRDRTAARILLKEKSSSSPRTQSSPRGCCSPQRAIHSRAELQIAPIKWAAI